MDFSSKGDQASTTQNATHILLHSIEPHSATSLALKMIEQWRQSPELPRTCPSRTVIHLLLVRGGIDMVVQALQLPEAFVTQIAFVASGAAIQRRRSSCDARRRLVERQELLRDEVVRIAASNLSEYGVAVE